MSVYESIRPIYKREDPTRLTRMNEKYRELCFKIGEESREEIACGDPQKRDFYSSEDWFWLYSVDGRKNYSNFWKEFRKRIDPSEGIETI